MKNLDLLADIDDLDDGDDQNQIDEESNQDDSQNNQAQVKFEQYGVTNIAAQKHSRLLTVNRDKFISHITKISQKIDEKIKNEDIKAQCGKQEKQEIIDDISKCNHYALEISRQVIAISKFIKRIYSKKIPELESIVTNDSLYCRSLLEIEQPQKQTIDEQNENKKEMFHYLSPHQRISLRISISSPRDPLSRQQSQQVLEAAKVVIELQNHYQVLMIYLETCMQVVAPNLCQFVGSVIASKLIAAAGGIDKLAAMPSCNIQVMGGSRSAQTGFSQLERNHTGIFGQMDLVRDAPSKFKMKLVRMLAGGTTKCARADYLGNNKDIGARVRDEMYDRFEKVQQEGGLSRTENPLQIPDMQPKKKRGGKRHRKMKEIYQLSDMRKNQNRMKFGQAEQQIEQGVGLGMLKSGTGKLKVNIKKQKLKISKKMQQRVNKKSGLESSLNIAAHQGIELINPALKEQSERQKGTDSYFAKSSGFRTVLNNKLGN